MGARSFDDRGRPLGASSGGPGRERSPIRGGGGGSRHAGGRPGARRGRGGVKGLVPFNPWENDCLVPNSAHVASLDQRVLRQFNCTETLSSLPVNANGTW